MAITDSTYESFLTNDEVIKAKKLASRGTRRLTLVGNPTAPSPDASPTSAPKTLELKFSRTRVARKLKDKDNRLVLEEFNPNGTLRGRQKFNPDGTRHSTEKYETDGTLHWSWNRKPQKVKRSSTTTTTDNDNRITLEQFNADGSLYKRQKFNPDGTRHSTEKYETDGTLYWVWNRKPQTYLPAGA